MWIRSLCQKHKVNLLGIQESKFDNLDLFTVPSFCGNNSFSHDFLHLLELRVVSLLLGTQIIFLKKVAISGFFGYS